MYQDRRHINFEFWFQVLFFIIILEKTIHYTLYTIPHHHHQRREQHVVREDHTVPVHANAERRAASVQLSVLCEA